MKKVKHFRSKTPHKPKYGHMQLQGEMNHTDGDSSTETRTCTSISTSSIPFCPKTTFSADRSSNKHKPSNLSCVKLHHNTAGATHSDRSRNNLINQETDGNQMKQEAETKESISLPRSSNQCGSKIKVNSRHIYRSKNPSLSNNAEGACEISRATPHPCHCCKSLEMHCSYLPPWMNCHEKVPARSQSQDVTTQTVTDSEVLESDDHGFQSHCSTRDTICQPTVAACDHNQWDSKKFWQPNKETTSTKNVECHGSDYQHGVPNHQSIMHKSCKTVGKYTEQQTAQSGSGETGFCQNRMPTHRLQLEKQKLVEYQNRLQDDLDRLEEMLNLKKQVLTDIQIQRHPSSKLQNQSKKYTSKQITPKFYMDTKTNFIDSPRQVGNTNSYPLMIPEYKNPHRKELPKQKERHLPGAKSNLGEWEESCHYDSSIRSSLLQEKAWLQHKLARKQLELKEKLRTEIMNEPHQRVFNKENKTEEAHEPLYKNRRNKRKTYGNGNIINPDYYMARCGSYIEHSQENLPHKLFGETGRPDELCLSDEFIKSEFRNEFQESRELQKRCNVLAEEQGRFCDEGDRILDIFFL